MTAPSLLRWCSLRGLSNMPLHGSRLLSSGLPWLTVLYKLFTGQSLPFVAMFSLLSSMCVSQGRQN